MVEHFAIIKCFERIRISQRLPINPNLYLSMVLISLFCTDVKRLSYACTTSHAAVFQTSINFADAFHMVFRCASVFLIL